MCREFFPYWEARIKIEFECPTECVEKGYNAKRTKNCDLCPQKREKETFRERVTDEIIWRIGKLKANKYRFDDLFEMIFKIKRLEGRTDLSVKAAILLSVYLSEKARFEREKPKPDL